MAPDRISKDRFLDLRRQAETLLAAKGKSSLAFEDDPLKLIHELETFQIELELQNEELHRSQKELMESKIRYTQLYDFAPVGYISLDPKGLIVSTNLTFAGMLLTERSLLINQPLSAVIVPENQDIYYTYKQTLFDAKRPLSCELRMKKKDGTPFDVRLESLMIPDDFGGIQEYRIAIMDISESMKAQNQVKQLNKQLGLEQNRLAESESLFRGLFDNMTSASAIYSVINDGSKGSDYIVKNLNKNGLKIEGKTLDQVVGKSIFDLRPNIDAYGLIPVMKKVWETGKPTDFPVKIYRDGIFSNYYENFIFKTSTGEVVTIYKDVTDRKNAEQEKKKLEQELKQAQKMESIGTLAGGIAHDFNNILYPIIGFAELSLEDLPENHPVKENLEDILQGAKRARDLVKQILAFSSQRAEEQKPLPLAPLIQEALKLIRSTIPSNIDIQQALYDTQDCVLASPIEIHEIVMNLCTNAYHAMEKTGGTLSIRLNKAEPGPELNLPHGDYCCLSISDTGMGIPPEIIDTIFDPYFTTKKVGKGSGLGLSVVHGITKNYQGAMTVESKPGKGTVFKIYLPITSTIEKPEETIEGKPSLGGNEKILFVDDEVAIVKLGVRLLERLGYKVTGKNSSRNALAVFKSAPDDFDLVITDMAMPEMVGTQFAAKLIEVRPDIPIIICTGFSEGVDIETAASLGIRDYINKPILSVDLYSKVRQVLDQTQKG